MFSKVKKCEININVSLDEILTSNTCTKLIIELVKYILYQKQQIPFTFDSLVQFHAKIKKADRNSSSIKIFLNSVKNVSDCLSSQFFLKGCKIKEIAIIVGATIISPKFYIILELPSEILNSLHHEEYEHPSRRALLSLMRSIMECTELQEAMTMPLGLTNTFLLLQKSDSNTASEFFLPKPQYILPTQTATCFRIKLHYNNEFKTHCKCANMVKIYREFIDSDIKTNSNVEFEEQSNNRILQAPYQWYQSKEVIKGFKYTR